MLDVDVKVHDFVYFMIDEQTSGANSKERQGRYLPPTRGQDESRYTSSMPPPPTLTITLSRIENSRRPREWHFSFERVWRGVEIGPSQKAPRRHVEE